MSGIFLSYRRDDASGWAGRLYEHLVRDWGPDQVFIDIDTIAPGEDFREAIAQTMDKCDVVLVVIGPNWVNARDELGNRRLDDEGDTHRAEIISALSADVRVVPVLVGGAPMPKVADLPDPLKGLAYRNAAVVEDRRFASDVSNLQSTLKKFAEEVLAERAPETVPAPVSAAGGRHEPMHSPVDPRSRADAGRDTKDPSGPRTEAFLTAPTVLALAGAALVLVWGILIERGWHNEFSGIRLAAGALLVVGVAAGVWARKWTWVLAAGVAGRAGLVLWMLQLLSTHSSEVSEIMSPADDGFANLVTFAGAVLVVVAATLGMRSQQPSR